MLPGPVFNNELLLSSRRRRYYVLRFVYGLTLLFLIWEYGFRWLGYENRSVEELTIQQMAKLGTSIFQTFAITQAVVLILLTPALVAGAISDERQRKTLNYLLASPLSSGEIILGKLSARLLHVGVVLTLGVPIQCMLTLFGGTRPEEILLFYAGTGSTVIFLSALSVAVSTYAKRPRDAISLVYTFTIIWLFVPTFIATFLPMGGSVWLEAYSWLRPANDWIGSTSPFHVMILGYLTARGPRGILEGTAWMIGLQMAWALLLVLWSVARLRPYFRKADESSGWFSRLSGGGRGKRILPRPSCGDDPMLWKERYVSRTSRAKKIVGLAFLTLLGTILSYMTYLTAEDAFRELAVYGYGSFTGLSYQNRLHFNYYLRSISTTVYLGWVLCVVSASATSMTSEREEETWVSLISTPLDGWEIVRAKMFGAVWGTRGLALVLMILWAVGLAAGSIHPFGVMTVAIQTAVFIWFTTALGTFISLRSKSSTRAMTATIGILIFLNGGYLMCCIPLDLNTNFVLVGMTPYVEFVSLIYYEEFWNLVHGGDGGGPWNAEVAATCLASPLFYALSALTLTMLSAAGFDDEIDRPRMSSMLSTVPSDPASSLLEEDEAEALSE